MRIAPVLLAAAVLLATPGVADEIRMKDGEVIHGTVERESKGRLRVRTGRGLRRLKLADIESRIEGEAPHVVLARREAMLGPQAGAARAALAVFAWRHRLDEAARRLAREAVAIDPDLENARRILGERRRREGRWVAGWKPPWGDAGQTGPRWGTAKRAALAAAGANGNTEAAVEAGLRWLAEHQDDDGRLDADGFDRHDPPDDRCDGRGGGHHGERRPCAFDGVTTATALMAWLTAGNTPVSGPYRGETARALAWCAHALEQDPTHGYDLWNHAFLTQAVADACAVTRDPDLLRALERATAAILRLQLEDGGFSYYLRIGDVPTTSAVASALGLAAAAGVVIEAERVERVLAFLDARLHRKSGRSEYHDGAERKGYTPTRANAASALAVRALLGRLGDAPVLTRQMAAISNRAPRWKLAFRRVETSDGRTVRAQIGNLYPYQWYYTTIALQQHGGARWRKWYGSLEAALRKGQRGRGAARGSWDPVGQYSSSAGRVFITALCTLMLEAPYRYPRGSGN